MNMHQRMIQVGDHDPERIRQTAAEAYCVRKTKWSVEEYRALADRFADATTKFQIAIANESFAGVVSAYNDFHEICHQANQMNIGLEHAITQARMIRETKR